MMKGKSEEKKEVESRPTVEFLKLGDTVTSQEEFKKREIKEEMKEEDVVDEEIGTIYPFIKDMLPDHPDTSSLNH